MTTTGGQIRIDGTRHDRPEGGGVRVGPEPTRNVCNETDGETHVWIMFGAPPVGTVEDFGEYVVDDE